MRFPGRHLVARSRSLRFADPAAAASLAFGARVLAEQRRCKDIEALAWMQEARLALDGGRTGDALEAYHNAAELFRVRARQWRYAHALRHEADLLRQAGLIAEARACYERGLGHYRCLEHAKPLAWGNALRGYAMVLELMGDSRAARNAWREARGLYEKAGRAERLAECDARLSELPVG